LTPPADRIRPIRLRAALAAVLVGLVAIAAACASTACARPARAAAALPYVAVSGNRLVGAGGETIRLLGVNRSSGEYMCLGGTVFDGPVDSAAVQAMVGWHINSVRVPLNEDCWLAINGVPSSSSGTAYRNAVEEYVRTLQSFGLIVILDLHWAAPSSYKAESQWPMADADHAPAFWSSVAAAFASNHGVIFDLFNEPFITSWSCWRNGCSTTFEVAHKTVTYQSAGMQSLVGAVRSAGATTQPIMLGGLQWSADESQWLASEPSDPDHALAASFHTYNWAFCHEESCWNSTLAPLAAKVPIVTGELGQNGCQHNYVDTFMPWADSNGVSYLGWTWNSTSSGWDCSAGPALIKDWEGHPTRYGKGLKKHLRTLARQSGKTRA
jgi:hypothetical protein